jgi:hypothetical protein
MNTGRFRGVPRQPTEATIKGFHFRHGFPMINLLINLI